MRTKSIIGLLFAIAALSVVVFNLPKAPYSAPPQTNDFPPSLSTSTPVILPALVPHPIPAATTSVDAPEPETASSDTAGPSVTFSIEEKHYSVAIENKMSVLGAMRALTQTSAFEFIGREYPSLGFFVESINGKKNADGFYWFLYINGESANTGVSQTILNENDAVEWRYKKGY